MSNDDTHSYADARAAARGGGRLIVGVSGATGVIYGIELLRVLRKLGIESHLVVTSAGEQARAYETTLSAKELREMADVAYSVRRSPAAHSRQWA